MSIAEALDALARAGVRTGEQFEALLKASKS